MTVPRTDLALEAADDLAARAKKFSLPEGIQRLESLQEGYPVTDIRVTGEGARSCAPCCPTWGAVLRSW